MADGIFLEFKDIDINRGVLGRFLSDPRGQVGERTKVITENLGDDIRRLANVDTGALRAGITIGDGSRSTSSGGRANISFEIRISTIDGAQEVGNAKRIAQNREYARYVNDRYHFVERGIRAAAGRNG